MEDDDMLDAPLAEVPANLGNPKPVLHVLNRAILL
jgi:hypothetical protein